MTQIKLHFFDMPTNTIIDTKGSKSVQYGMKNQE
jgi:hypothetical protein